MNIKSKLCAAIIFASSTVLLMSVTSSGVIAKQNDSGRQGPPQRPSFSSIDTDSNDEISFDEFSTHEIPFGDHQTIFDSIDTDNDGVITLEEYENHKPPQNRNK